MNTKKCLVAFNPEAPSAHSGDFLVPVRHEGVPKLLGMESGKYQSFGRVVFVGRAVTANDLFARLVDSGQDIDSVDRVLKDLETYLAMVKNERIGNVVELQEAADTTVGFILSRRNMTC